MAKFKSNFPDKIKSIFKGVEGSIVALVTKELLKNLMANKAADNTAQPKKAESTKKQYVKKGYNTEDYLVRTGDSTKLNVTIGSGNIKIQPKQPDILAYHKEEAEKWFTLPPDLQTKIINIIKEKI